MAFVCRAYGSACGPVIVPVFKTKTSLPVSHGMAGFFRFAPVILGSKSLDSGRERDGPCPLAYGDVKSRMVDDVRSIGGNQVVGSQFGDFCDESGPPKWPESKAGCPILALFARVGATIPSPNSYRQITPRFSQTQRNAAEAPLSCTGW